MVFKKDWSIVNLQCFRCTAKWFNYTYVHIHIYICIHIHIQASQMALVVKNLPANTGDATDVGPVPGSGRSPGEGNGNPLQYPCLGNSMNRGAWLAIVHVVTKTWTILSAHTHTHKHTHTDICVCLCAQLLSCVQLCSPVAYSLPGSFTYGNF